LAFGTPTSSQWPDMVFLPDYVEYQYVPAPPLRSLFPMATDDALDLLSKMFTYDPKARISLQQALEHRYLPSASHYDTNKFLFSIINLSSSTLGTSLLLLCLQIQTSSLDLLLRRNLRLLISIYRRVLLCYHLQGSLGE